MHIKSDLNELTEGHNRPLIVKPLDALESTEKANKHETVYSCKLAGITDSKAIIVFHSP